MTSPQAPCLNDSKFIEKRQQVLHSAAEINSLFVATPALKTSIGAQPAALPENLRAAVARADFSAETWILVAWGAQPNPGYRPHTTQQEAHFADGSLQLPLVMQTPAAGEIYAQVIATPCQIVRVAQSLPVERIELQ